VKSLCGAGNRLLNIFPEKIDRKVNATCCSFFYQDIRLAGWKKIASRLKFFRNFFHEPDG